MRRSRTREGTAISLFPFLAVLLCTMGALLVLLVLFGNSINQQEDALAIEQAEQVKAELAGRADNLSWRLEQLTSMRSKTNDELESLRLQLAGIEENSRELSANLQSLQKVQENLFRNDSFDSPTDNELLTLEEKLTSARESLDEARRERDSRPPAYAVIPYEGPSGTHRRPLFIECCLDGVFLQPEGIRLNPDDFEGPPGPGNPLASGLRAAREYLARQSISQDDPGLRPYPLLIVRPSGVMAYYAARDAISSWGSDFGYQLVEEDWRLAFPEKDLALRDAELQAINEARDRLKWLTQTRSNIRQRSPVRKQYRAASVRGGAVAVGGPSVLGDQSQWDWSKQQAKAGRASGGHTLQGQGTNSQGQVSTNAVVGRPLSAGESSGGSHFGKGQSETGIGHGDGGSASTGSLTGLAGSSPPDGMGGDDLAGDSHFGNGQGKEISSVDGRSGGGHGRSKDGSNATQRGTDEGSPGGTEVASSGGQQGGPQLLVVSVLERLLRKVKVIQPVRLAALLVAECQCHSVYKLGRTPGRQQCRVPHRVSRAVQAARCPALGGAIGQALRHRSDISRLPVLFRSSALLKSYVCLTIQVIGSCIGYPLRGQLFNLLIL